MRDSDVLPRIGASELGRLVGPGDAIRVLGEALLGGLDPEDEPARTATDMTRGQLLLMPSEGGGYAGVKVASVAPGNPALGLPRISAVYLLLDAATLLPLAVLDGTALTALRTPTVSALAVDLLVEKRGPVDVVVFGSGPQAWGHVQALGAVRPLGSVSVVARDPGRAAALVARCTDVGIPARVGIAGDVAGADVVCCCTSSRVPVFDGAAVRDDAVVVAVGSHEPDARELDSALVVRAGAVIVEARGAAWREAGDLVVPRTEGRIGASRVTGNLAELVRGRLGGAFRPGPRVFKSVGMGWEDLVVAAEAYRRWGGSASATGG